MAKTDTAEATDALKELRAAEKATASATAAEYAAAGLIAAAKQEITDATAEVDAALAAAALGDESSESRARIDRARARIGKARDDIEWADLQRLGAESASRQAHTREAKANRAVAAQEYRAAHTEFNDPNSRENVLLTQLADTLVELIPMIRARRELHTRLAQAYEHFPAEERFPIPQGRPITPNASRIGGWTVDLPFRELADIIESASRDHAAVLQAERQAASNAAMATMNAINAAAQGSS